MLLFDLLSNMMLFDLLSNMMWFDLLLTVMWFDLLSSVTLLDLLSIALLSDLLLAVPFCVPIFQSHAPSMSLDHVYRYDHEKNCHASFRDSRSNFPSHACHSIFELCSSMSSSYHCECFLSTVWSHHHSHLLRSSDLKCRVLDFRDHAQEIEEYRSDQQK